MEYVVEMIEIRKEFPGIVACDDINLQVIKGEIHALLGENGAGKSTLMNVLFGLYQPEKGIIRLRGKEVKISNPNDANRVGIAMVHQHFKLVHNFTVTENIILGLESKKGLFIDTATATKRIQELSEKYGLQVDPNAKISEISVGMQQRVEILKMLYRKAEILIFDEPTAVLTPQEITELMKIMENLVKEGKTIILITHKLREIKAIADRCTVIRRGKYIATVNVKETTEEKMAEMMVGRKVSFTTEKKECKVGATILKLEGVTVEKTKGINGLKDVSLEVKCGEILGIAGVDGNGQEEMVQAIIGLRKTEKGKIILNGKEIDHFPIRKRINQGLAHIPADRHKHGLILDYSLGENMILMVYYKEPFSHKGILKREEIDNYGNKIVEEFDVRSGEGAKSSARSLSGGNQQKAIVGREIFRNADLLIAVQPTRGLDVGAIEYIHKRIIEQRDRGKAVLLVSLELDEILDLSDRIAVLNSGELVGIVDSAEADENKIGLMMAGIKRGESA